LLSRVIEDRSQALNELGIRLDAGWPECPCTAFGDPQRTQQAISAALDATVAASSSGDSVKVDTFTTKGFLEVSFESTGKIDNGFKSFDRLNLSVARANILSQQGLYQFTQEPFRISLALPAHELELENSETHCCAAHAG
jgi:hypothetical protein